MKFGFNKVRVVLIMMMLTANIGYSQKCKETGSIRRVKNKSVGNVDYVIFDIYKQNASTTSQMSYDVETTSAPFIDYSDNKTIPIKGKNFKKIKFK